MRRPDKIVPTWSLSDRLRKARREYAHLPQGEFAARLGLQQGAYAAWEAGRSTPRNAISVAKRVEVLTGVDAAWLLGLTEDAVEAADVHVLDVLPSVEPPLNRAGTVTERRPALIEERRVPSVMRLVLVGPPGAGKGTQAERLAERLDVPHISTGDLFRANLEQETELGVEARRFMDAGDLVPDEVTVAMVRERLAEPDAGKGFILDGFPRNVSQAGSLGELLAERDSPLDAVVEFQVPEDLLVERLLARGRTDDTEDVIRRRQEVYRDETAPLLAHYADQLVTVDATGSVEEITQRVVDALQAR